jgi:hypothetical protein
MFNVTDTVNARLRRDLQQVYATLFNWSCQAGIVGKDMLIARKAPESSTATPTDARRELLERVLASSVFAKSERLSSLLSFVCELTLQGREKELNEQRIGEAVFGRSRDYDSSIDGIVRTQASRLRNRLDLYFNADGIDEPVRIVIPRGGYVPRFEPLAFIEGERRIASSSEAGAAFPVETRLDENSGNVAEGTAADRLPGRRRSWYAMPVVPWVLLAMVTIASLVIVLKERANAKSVRAGSTPHPIWSRMFAGDKPTLIVTGDSGLVMWQGLMGRNVHLAEYLNGDFRTQLGSSGTVNREVAADLGSRRYTSIVDLDIVQSLLPIAQSGRGRPLVRYARDVRPNDFKQGNAILIGTAEATPWVELFEPNMNFYFLDDREKHVFSVFNRSPKGTEAKQWDSVYSDPQHRVYAVVAYLPNLSGQGNALILEGTSMAGTESAWDFVADESQLLPFLNRIRNPDGSLPHFEVVLGTNNINGSAGKNIILAWRTTH